MIWVGVAVGVAALALLLIGAVRRFNGQPDSRVADDVDPLFTTGIAITGAGVVLGVTIGAFMYVMMVVGLILMAIGANRTRHPRH